jgi:hypothetical protein
MDVTLEVHCGQCGSANYSLEGAAGASGLQCNDCGQAMGSLASLQEELLGRIIAGSAEALRSEIGRD